MERIIPRASHTGQILGDLAVDVYVVDGEPLVSQRGALAALMGARNAAGPKPGNFKRYLARLGQLAPEFAGIQLEPNLRFRAPSGREIVHGLTAEQFFRICDAYETAYVDGLLRGNQTHIGENARRLVKANAKGGFAAWIYDACGYVPERGAIAKIVNDAACPWDIMWTAEVARQLCRLYGWKWVGGRQPRLLASVYDRIYKLLLKDSAAKLKAVNPKPRFGSNHHQYLVEKAREALRRDVRLIAGLAETSRSPTEFWSKMETIYDGKPLQLWLA